MESEQQSSISSDLLGTVVRPPSIRISGSFKSNLSGRLTPRSSPSFQRSPSVRTPLRQLVPPPLPWYQKPFFGRRLLPWLVVICVWAHIGLLMQSRWAHNDGQATLLSHLQADHDSSSHVFLEQWEIDNYNERFHRNASDVGLIPPLTKTDKGQQLEDSQSQYVGGKTQGSKPMHPIERSSEPDASTRKNESILNSTSWIFPLVGTVNASIGTLFGPFEDLEKSTLGSIRSKLSFCSHERAFSGYVRGRSFMLVFHELSMTGSPLAMLELANEILSCGGKVVVVALSKKGGLLQELLAKKIRVLRSRDASTFKAAASVDLIVAGSAVCASWIEDFQLRNKKGHKRLVWWIMENRKEYFNRSKHMLGLAKALIFLSEAQSKQWTTWSKTENISLPHKVHIIPLCVNEELSLRSGLYDSNIGPENTMQPLRHLVRAEMGLKPYDVLFTSLSSINPGKGQLKLLQAVAMVVEDSEASSKDDFDIDAKVVKGTHGFTDEGHSIEASKLKLLLGSVGSKSNKVDYIQKMLEYIGNHPRLAELILWTPVSVHVASLYAASDVYVMNSQGIGETFGRVTVEAMAFSLPILGTSAGGTSEIVDANTSGLLHPIGADGVHILAEHISLLLKNATLRESMGLKGKDKVKQSYMKETMYENLAAVFSAP